MKSFLTFCCMLAASLTFVACASNSEPPPEGPSFKDITPSPKVHDTVHGCWFDPTTVVYRGAETKTLCDLRKNGEDVTCRDLCESSARKVHTMCGNVRNCSALLWVDEENPLSDETENDCWKCVEGCTYGLDRSPERYNLCRQEESDETVK